MPPSRFRLVVGVAVLTGLFMPSSVQALRHFDPKHGRWLQRDPIGYEGGGMNLYEYVLSRPTMLTDPKGTCPIVFPADINWGMVNLSASSNYFKFMHAELAVNMVVGGAIPSRKVYRSLCCTKIGVVQIEQNDKDKRGLGDWTLDGNPWYPYSRSSPPEKKNTFGFNDVPGWDPVGHYRNNEFEQNFETCVVCVTIDNKITCVLSCITWGHKWRINMAPPPDHTVSLTINNQSTAAMPPAQNPLGPSLITNPTGKRPTQRFITLIRSYRNK